MFEEYDELVHGLVYRNRRRADFGEFLGICSDLSLKIFGVNISVNLGEESSKLLVTAAEGYGSRPNVEYTEKIEPSKIHFLSYSKMTHKTSASPEGWEDSPKMEELRKYMEITMNDIKKGMKYRVKVYPSVNPSFLYPNLSQ